MERYVEPGGSWRPFWVVAAAMGAFLALDLVLPGGDLPPLMWAIAPMTVLGIVAAGCRSARRMWTVRVDDHALSVGLERVPLSDVDVERLRAVESGADAGAQVLGGGWSLPRGRTGLPLRLAGGRSVLVPTRDPVGLRSALLAALSVPRGTLDP
ncbi:hypothetical protein E4P39_08265 [Blastococcus sp. CT_GayMR19]|uniref:hypothetical protein n=1 Tax=Blastococcus sp. CT_GayMR19 TaxID=2559608 RepID=UPI001074004B|nr:hypothetical protein [Blastococcus sp. CT_GayMR19]TFV76878.1 hypothetical protein E4P39_08265 [Blastococcus sp. CT_GayMR19]